MYKRQKKKSAAGTGGNSFVATRPFGKFLIDLFFMAEPDPKYSTGMLAVDIFTKPADVIPQKKRRKVAYPMAPWWSVARWLGARDGVLR